GVPEIWPVAGLIPRPGGRPEAVQVGGPEIPEATGIAEYGIPTMPSGSEAVSTCTVPGTIVVPPAAWAVGLFVGSLVLAPCGTTTGTMPLTIVPSVVVSVYARSVTVADSLGLRGMVGFPMPGSSIEGSFRTAPGAVNTGFRTFARRSSWFCSKSWQSCPASVLYDFVMMSCVTTPGGGAAPTSFT